jgi:hypothetical protein
VVQRLAVLAEQVHGAPPGLVQQVGDLGVDDLLVAAAVMG